MRPVDILSMQTIELPRAMSTSHKCDPRNPAPPVTSTHLIIRRRKSGCEKYLIARAYLATTFVGLPVGRLSP
jgi:hypothetical protein